MGGDMAPHSTSQPAVERFIEWFRKNRPEQHAWIMANEFLERRYTYQQAVKNLKKGFNAWE